VKRLGLIAAVLVTAALVQAPAANAGSAQNTLAGAVAVADYDLGDTAFSDPRSGTVSEIRAEVYYPRVLVGRRPLIVLSHGSWWACDVQSATTWPCPAGSHPFPSYRGYAFLGKALAAQGFVVVAISADAINMTSFDYGDRARLINEHLSLWEQLADHGNGPLAGKFFDPATEKPVTPSFAGHVDLTDVGTLGHSRGGKGVMWQASDKHKTEWPAGVQIRAVLGLAPVKFDDPEGDHSDTLITTLPFAVVTGGCDGAVREDGQQYLDDVTGHNTVTDFSVSLIDANHNYYNTNWSPPYPFGEDDSTCPNTELTQGRQHDALTTYATAFYRYELYGDRSGLPILTGRAHLGVADNIRVVPAAS
jgi:hypothetical protein